MVKVELTQEEMDRCKTWGDQREDENAGRRDIADYDHRRFNLTGRQNNRLGVLTEFAVYKWLGFDTEAIDLDIWTPFVPTELYGKYLGKPDIAGQYEVRRANGMGNPIPIRAKDIKCGADIIQGYVNYTQKAPMEPIIVRQSVTLLGWVNAREAWETADVPPWSYGSSRVTHDKRAMEEFRGGVLVG